MSYSLYAKFCQFLSLLRLDTIKKCAEVAKSRGYKIFALINEGECLATKHKNRGYKRFGRSKKCSDGEGAVGAMNVYKLTGLCSFLYIHLGQL